MGMVIVRGNAYVILMKDTLSHRDLHDILQRFRNDGVYYLAEFNAFVIYDLTHPRSNTTKKYRYLEPSIQPYDSPRPDLPSERQLLLADIMNLRLRDGDHIGAMISKHGWHYIEYLRNENSFLHNM